MRYILPITMRQRAVICIVPVFDPFLPLPTVHDLPRSQSVVSIGPKVIHEGARVFKNHIGLPFFKSEELRGVRIETENHTGPRRIADRDIAMGLRERHPAIHQPLHIGRLCLGMAAKGFDVVIEVVADDQDDIRTIGTTNKEREKEKRKEGFWKHKWSL